MIRLANIAPIVLVAAVLAGGQGDAQGQSEGRQGGSVAGKSGFEQADVFVAGELGYKEFRFILSRSP